MPPTWLPAAVNEVQDLAWFRDHFRGEQFALVSWDGCTLGQRRKTRAAGQEAHALARGNCPRRRQLGCRPTRAQWFARVTTGPRVIDQLMARKAALATRTPSNG